MIDPTQKEHYKCLTTEYHKIQNLCKIMEELALDVASSCNPNQDQEQSDKADQLMYLAMTIKDFLLSHEDGFSEAINTYDVVAEEEDFRDFISLYGFLEESDKKNLIELAVLRTQKHEEEQSSINRGEGNWFYDLRTSMAEKYGLELSRK